MFQCILSAFSSLFRHNHREISSTDVTPPYIFVCLNPGPNVPSHSIVVIVVFSDFRFKSEVIHVVLVGNILNHYCLTFYFQLLTHFRTQ